MNSKKTALLVLTLLVLITAVAAVSAADDTTTSTDQVSTQDTPTTATTDHTETASDSSSAQSSQDTSSTSTSDSSSSSAVTSVSSNANSDQSSSKSVNTQSSSSQSTTKASESTQAPHDSQSTQSTTTSESSMKDTSTSQSTVNTTVVDDSKTLKQAQTHNVTNETFKEFFEDDGTLGQLVNEGDTLDFRGNFFSSAEHNYTMNINKPVNIISSTNDVNISLNTTSGDSYGGSPGDSFTITQAGSGTNVTGLYFYNTQIFVRNASNVIFDNITCINENQTVGAGVGVCSIREGSSYVTVKNSYFRTEANGGHSTLVLANANYCTFDNNTIEGHAGANQIGNLIYLTTYNVEVEDYDHVNEYNNITNNNISVDASMSVCYGIGLCGNYNLIANNTISNPGGAITIQWGSGTGSEMNGTGSIRTVENTFSGNVANGGYVTIPSYSTVEGNVFNVTGAITFSGYSNITNNTLEGQSVIINNEESTVFDNTIYSNSISSVTLNGSYNNVTENYLESTRNKGDDSVNDTGIENIVLANRPYTVIMELNTTEVLLNTENEVSVSLYKNNEEALIDSGKATITIDDYQTTINIVDGVGSFTYTPTKSGDHTVTIQFVSDTGLSQDTTTALQVTAVRDPEKTFNVYNYQELLDAVETISSYTTDTEYYIVLQPGDDENAYDITETITWGTGVVKTITIDGYGQTVNGNNQYQFISILEGYTLNLENIIVTDCTSTNGGVIVNNNGNLEITDSQFIANTATENGAVIYSTTDDDHYVTLTDNTFNDNQAPQNDVIYTNNTITMNGNNFILADDVILESGSTTVTSPILDTSLSSSEKVTFEIVKDDTTIDTVEVTKNSNSIVETDYTFNDSGKYDVIINYETTYANNTIIGDVYVENDNYLTVTCYEELVEAIERVKTLTADQSITIVLLSNSDPTAYDVTETITWDNTVVTGLTINGNGQTINGKTTEQFMIVDTYSKITLTDINVVNCTAYEGGAIKSAGTLIVTDSTFRDNYATSYAGAIYSQGTNTISSNLTIINSSFINNTADDEGSAVYIWFGNATVTNAIFINNTETGNSGNGALYHYVGSIDVSHSIFINNTAGIGAGIGLGDSNGTLSDLLFINNTAKSSNSRTGGYGGAMYVGDGCEINATNLYITGSTSSVYGGGIFNRGNLTLSNSVITGNGATTYGAGIQNNGTLTLINSTVSNNTATTYGGGIVNHGDLLNITDSIFSGNRAVTYAGVISSDRGNVIISNSVFEDNSASTYAGVIYNTKNLTISNSTFTNNNAGSFDGIIYSNAGNVTIDSSTFVNNSASTVTGAVGLYNANGVITNSVFENNTATQEGYEIYFNATSSSYTLELSNNTISNTISNYNKMETKLTSPVYNSQLSQDEVITVQIDGDSVETTTQSGVVSIEYIFTDSGEIYVVYNYPSYPGNNIMTIATIISSISVEVQSLDVTSGSDVTLTATVTENGGELTGGYVVFKVNGKTVRDDDGNVIEVQVVDGVAEYTYSLPYTLSDIYTISAIYVGADGDVYRTQEDAVITVLPNVALVDISTYGTLRPGQTVTFNAFIMYENQTSVQYGKVVFKLNGVSLRDADGNVLYAYVEDGIARLEYTIPDNYSAKDYVLTAVFQADGFERTEANMTITLTKIDTQVVIDESLLTLSASSSTPTKNSITNDITYDTSKTSTVTTYDDATDSGITTYDDATGSGITTYDDASEGTITITQGENLQLKATIIDQETGEAMKGTTKVAVKFNEKTVIQQYVTDGVIDITLYTSSFRNPTYTITVIAGENSQYNESSFNGTLVVAAKD